MNTNGILSLQDRFTDFSPDPFPIDGLPLVAPFWDDVNIQEGGTIYYRQTTNSLLLEDFHNELVAISPSLQSFHPTWLFIATWFRVAEFGGGIEVWHSTK